MAVIEMSVFLLNYPERTKKFSLNYPTFEGGFFFVFVGKISTISKFLHRAAFALNI